MIIVKSKRKMLQKLVDFIDVIQQNISYHDRIKWDFYHDVVTLADYYAMEIQQKHKK